MYTWQDFRRIPDVRAEENIRSLKSYAIQSQYAASPVINALIDAYQVRLSPRRDIRLFYDKMFNILTAEGVGLDNWGVIVQIGRTITDPDTDVSITLDDEYYRLLLLYKALANISASTAEAQNRLLSVLLSTGVAGMSGIGYVLEIDTMEIRWVFEQDLTAAQLTIFKVAGTLARGAGVGWNMYAANKEHIFGFDGSELQPFNQAPFAPDNAYYSPR